jgi:hypothetical protein
MTTNRLLVIHELTRLVEDERVDAIEALVYEILALRLAEAVFREDAPPAA